jgi:hypothetical protein
MSLNNSLNEQVKPAAWWPDLQAPPPRVKPPAVRPIALATTRKKKAKERGRLAADWLAGRAQLKNTTINAALIFKVSRPYVSAAKANGNANGGPSPKADPLARAWARASEDERRTFAIVNACALLDTIDTFTRS